MCIKWLDRNQSGEKPRKAERFTMAMMQEKRGQTRLGENDECERYQAIPTVGDWMSIEPGPIEVLVELTWQQQRQRHNTIGTISAAEGCRLKRASW